MLTVNRKGKSGDPRNPTLVTATLRYEQAIFEPPEQPIYPT